MLVDVSENERENADITDTPSQYWIRAMCLPFVDHLLQEMDPSLFVVQIHYVVQYITPRQRLNMTLDCPTV